ncbi:hypothetical protein AB0M20_20850, partial [Actinoplanes sp. NPDC051633]
NYVVRPAPAQLLPPAPVRASITGAGGELGTGFWYPKPGQDQTPEQAALAHLLGPAGVVPAYAEQEHERVTAILRHAKDIGVRDEHLIDYIYLVHPMRRWSSAAYMLNIVTPFLRPGLVSVMFSLTAQQKRDRVLHFGLVKHLVPEWADVPYVAGGVAATTNTSTVPKIWEGDGPEVIADLLDTAQGPLAKMVDTKTIEDMLSGKRPPSPKAMQRFSYLAVASHRLEPDTVQPSTGATLRRVTRVRQRAARQASPTTGDRIVARMRWVKRTAAGRAIWNAAGKRLNPLLGREPDR